MDKKKGIPVFTVMAEDKEENYYFPVIDFENINAAREWITKHESEYDNMHIDVLDYIEFSDTLQNVINKLQKGN